MTFSHIKCHLSLFFSGLQGIEIMLELLTVWWGPYCGIEDSVVCKQADSGFDEVAEVIDIDQ